MTPELIEKLFTRADGAFLCARWGRPIVPVIFGVDEVTLSTFKGAIEAVVGMSGHKMAETDPELGANLMVFFLRDWRELPEVAHLEQMVPNLGPLCEKLAAARANQYRTFRFDKDGSIKAVFIFIRLDEHLAELPAMDIALVQAAEAMLTWGEGAFTKTPALAKVGDYKILDPDLAALIRAAYAPNLPIVETNPAHALRLSARMAQAQAEALAQNGA